ncbi:hypothetical protein PRZ48_006759 [Zasmidium cellare]|uniref:FAD-binding PCMH-type domain-containing protein n=1 Tax=Zasmidium cellare TaxID=395010 RepID=A0ABR0EIJ5_ZASCE|nr:hypothetical protein PRZ48_006759 [Zasmidium cellare]
MLLKYFAATTLAIGLSVAEPTTLTGASGTIISGTNGVTLAGESGTIMSGTGGETLAGASGTIFSGPNGITEAGASGTIISGTNGIETLIGTDGTVVMSNGAIITPAAGGESPTTASPASGASTTGSPTSASASAATYTGAVAPTAMADVYMMGAIALAGAGALFMIALLGDKDKDAIDSEGSVGDAVLQYVLKLDAKNSYSVPVKDSSPDGGYIRNADGSLRESVVVTYVVNATTMDQVVKTVEFVAEHNLELVVKNTGHDYLGRSTASGGFSLWTEHLKTATFAKNLTTAGCTQARDVVVAGAGVNVGELYQVADENNALCNGGYNPTVGACGGYWMLGGIGSPFGPILGYGVDRIAQFEIVLANGTVTIASECQNTDLYWAVKGGGGVYGLVTRVWVLAAPKPEKVNIVAGTFTANSSQAYTDLVDTMVDTSPEFRDPAKLTSCLMVALDSTFQILCIKAFNSSETVVSADQSQAVFGPVSSVEGVTTALESTQYDTWYEAYQAEVVAIVQQGAPTGLSLLDVSRALLDTTLYTDKGRQSVKDFLLAVDRNQSIIFEWNGGFATTTPPTKYSSIHPEFRKSVGYIVSPVESSSNGPTTALQNSTMDHLSGLLDKYIGTTAYPNEENVRTNDIQQRFWGPNYPKLVDLKRQYDPDNVFTCKSCVSLD